jgi:single-strand DNA-binding protein
MYGTPITIVGNVVDTVALKRTESGLSRLSFRVASTQRRKDRETGQWVDGHKLFVNVTFWREFAENVAQSLTKGDPVVVHGRIYSKQYVKEETNRVSYEIEPESIGHDLARGVSMFSKRKGTMSGEVVVDAEGNPALEDDDYEFAPQDQPAAEADRELVRPLIATG